LDEWLTEMRRADAKADVLLSDFAERNHQALRLF
jgi:hypothetical protein